MNLIFVVIFVFEMLIKLITYGVFMHTYAYFRNGWDVLDGFIVITSLLSLALRGSGFGAIRAVRTLRVLRPLRLIKRNEGRKGVINTLLASIPNIMNVFAIGALFWIIFAILGVQFFGGRFGQCSDPSVNARGDCTGTFVDANGDTVEREWEIEQGAELMSVATADWGLEQGMGAHACVLSFLGALLPHPILQDLHIHAQLPRARLLGALCDRHGGQPVTSQLLESSNTARSTPTIASTGRASPQGGT